MIVDRVKQIKRQIQYRQEHGNSSMHALPTWLLGACVYFSGTLVARSDGLAMGTEFATGEQSALSKVGLSMLRQTRPYVVKITLTSPGANGAERHHWPGG